MLVQAYNRESTELARFEFQSLASLDAEMASTRLKALFSRDLAPGSVLASEDIDIHQVSNLQDGGAELVTLHVYSPPLLVMGTYSLTDRTRGEEPMLLEFSDAAGI